MIGPIERARHAAESSIRFFGVATRVVWPFYWFVQLALARLENISPVYEKFSAYSQFRSKVIGDVLDSIAYAMQMNEREREIAFRDLRR